MAIILVAVAATFSLAPWALDYASQSRTSAARSAETLAAQYGRIGSNVARAVTEFNRDLISGNSSKAAASIISGHLIDVIASTETQLNTLSVPARTLSDLQVLISACYEEQSYIQEEKLLNNFRPKEISPISFEISDELVLQADTRLTRASDRFVSDMRRAADRRP
jgi:hypothetical protein